jgi:glutamate racemase
MQTGASAGSMPLRNDAPVGVFDSGIGGLSVLRHIQLQLPHEHLLYFADAGFAPYGGRPEHEVVARSLAIAAFLLQQGAKALVVACNTATAAAIAALRAQYPSVPLVGVEPGLKPAAAVTVSRIVGVLATENTLASAKFIQLRQQIAAATQVRILTQPCAGLADQIEKGELQSAATAAMLTRYVMPLMQQGADTLVLGCTHYPFVQPLIENIISHHGHAPVTIVDTGEAVARQLARLLTQHACARPEGDGTLRAYSSGSEASLANAFARLLHARPAVMRVAAEGNA